MKIRSFFDWKDEFLEGVGSWPGANGRFIGECKAIFYFVPSSEIL